MKTDCELLGLAAKAAGLVGWEIHDTPTLGLHIWAKSLFEERGSGVWRPIDDDGDALRLAVRLKFAVNVWSGCSVMTGAALNATCVLEDISEDPYAATRRAIVRAAAAIGEAMP